MKLMPAMALCCALVVADSTVINASSCSNSCSSSNSCSNPCSPSCSSSISSTCHSKNAHCKPEFLPFSQGENRARDYAGIAHFQHLPDQEDSYWYANLAIEYNENFDRDDLGSYFFPQSNTLTVGPNGTPGVDIRNVDVGLSDTFFGTLTINPRIRNLIVEPAFYLGLDHWLSGLFVWIKFPITHTRWNLECCETDTELGGVFFDQVSEMSNGVSTFVPATGLNQIQQAFVGTMTWGDKLVPLQNCRINCCRDTQNGIADIPLHVGWTFLNSYRGYLGLYLRTVFPTGKKHDFDLVEHRGTIFDARLGYDRWQAGAGINGACKYQCNDFRSYNLFFDVYVTHIFNKAECRCFDLKANGCMSRYLLMKQANENGMYTGELANFVDVFSGCATTNFKWNLDGLIFFNVKHKTVSWDLGYEIKVRDKERYDCDCPISLCNPSLEKPCGDCCLNMPNNVGTNFYGIKGTSLVEAIGQTIETESQSTISTASAPDAGPVLISSGNFASQIDLNRTAFLVQYRIKSGQT